MKTKTPYKFFYENAGFSVCPGETTIQGRRRSAHELERAERMAKNRAGLDYIWTIEDMDTSPWLWSTTEGTLYRTRSIRRNSFFTDVKPAWSLWSCQMILNDNDKIITVASLGGIDFGRDGEPWGNSYKRVVEAELAIEYFGLK